MEIKRKYYLSEEKLAQCLKALKRARLARRKKAKNPKPIIYAGKFIRGEIDRELYSGRGMPRKNDYKFSLIK